MAALGIFIISSQTGFSATVLPPQISRGARMQIRALELEKASRSPVHRKLDSQLVYQLKQNRNELRAIGITNVQPAIKFETDGRVRVDIDAEISESLITQITNSGGTIVRSMPRYHSVRAIVPVAQLETLAQLSEVKFIKRAVRAQMSSGSINSAGDATHGAETARLSFGATGAGVKVGVLSDSVDHLAESQASGDLPTNVVVLAGQGGSGEGEGTAMLEIIHDLAPDAELYFATGNDSEESFAQNILDLRTNGCDIIVDDVLYFDESPFQDSIVAQAVNSVTADGALYFSSAGNNGNLNGTTSTTWEGDFADGGAVDPDSPIGQLGEGGSRFHDFGGLTFNRVLTAYNVDILNVMTLFWSDPLGGSPNDYDLFVLNPTGTEVVFISGDYQTGTQDPLEGCYCTANQRVVVVKYSGDERFLHLQVMGNGSARLNVSTRGNITGHPAATNAICVGAINAAEPYSNPFGADNAYGPFPDEFTAGNTSFVEWFSSDGPRRVFFHADGSPITPGVFSSAGGAIRLKPDITAADGVANTVPGPFQPRFYGTSASAPHAAAIAALLKSFNHSLTAEQIRTALTSTALDIEDPGYDRDSGAGIVMPGPALQYLATLLTPVIESCALTNEIMSVTWTSLTNITYQLQYTTNLAEPNWANLGSPVAATNTVTTTTDEYPADPYRFYRVMVVP